MSMSLVAYAPLLACTRDAKAPEGIPDLLKSVNEARENTLAVWIAFLKHLQLLLKLPLSGCRCSPPAASYRRYTSSSISNEGSPPMATPYLNSNDMGINSDAHRRIFLVGARSYNREQGGIQPMVVSSTGNPGCQRHSLLGVCFCPMVES